MKWLARSLVLAAAVFAVGCGPDYDRTEISGIVALAGGECTRERITLRHGTVLKVHIVSKDDGNDEMTNSVSSAQPNILEVANVISDHDYAFLGVSPGRTEVEIKAEGKTVLIIDAFVVAQ